MSQKFKIRGLYKRKRQYKDIVIECPHYEKNYGL